MNKVERFYNEVYDEWIRLDRHKIEFDITKRYLDLFIKKKNSKILDCGGGPGRYSIYLSQLKHRVTLFDLSSKNIEIAKIKNEELGGSVERFIVGDALKLDDYNLEKYDYILLMGPLYHILNKDLRKKVLYDLKKYLKDDGLIFATFISNYAPMVDYIKHMSPPNSEELIMLKYIDDGLYDGEGGFTEAYFSSSEEAISLMEECGYKKIKFINIENAFGLIEDKINALPEDEYQKWLDICFKLGDHEKLFGVGEHYLYIGETE